MEQLRLTSLGMMFWRNSMLCVNLRIRWWKCHSLWLVNRLLCR